MYVSPLSTLIILTDLASLIFLYTVRFIKYFNFETSHHPSYVIESDGFWNSPLSVLNYNIGLRYLFVYCIRCCFSVRGYRLGTEVFPLFLSPTL